ncbi:uncharacterized protein LOC103723999 [Phoenix dactylifera]|uniref:Uncharacterized protein LOC103723999 n=1 Tax=Phoenix dactylifera TaxID=42345 RepID=A0A8B7D518_PHODC|nr:uncharacterized protein LOC103723999 [Phoenix dactylifera]
MDWSTMIPDLSKRISDKLPHCFDYFNFRLVCAHWRSAARPKKFPTMLVLPSDSDSAELPFFDPSDGGVHFHPLPVSARNKMIRGASRGWLALMDVPTKSVSLVNPFTGGEFPLPPTPNQLFLDFHGCDDSDLDSSLCGDVDGDGTCGHRCTEHYYIGVVVMSSAPNSGTECMVVAQEITRDQLCFCRPGDPKWTPIFPSSEINLSCEIRRRVLRRQILCRGSPWKNLGPGVWPS